MFFTMIYPLLIYLFSIPSLLLQMKENYIFFICAIIVFICFSRIIYKMIRFCTEKQYYLLFTFGVASSIALLAAFIYATFKADWAIVKVMLQCIVLFGLFTFIYSLIMAFIHKLKRI